jgi:hypothetical protein
MTVTTRPQTGEIRGSGPASSPWRRRFTGSKEMAMKTMERNRGRVRLSVDTLAVDTFSTAPELEAPKMGVPSASACTYCPTAYESECPCCTGIHFC